MDDITSFLIGTMLNSGGGEPDHKNWAPIGHADVPYTASALDFGWSITAEKKED